MTKFDIAFNYVIQNEGTEFVDDPTDKGGATKFGISLRFLQSLKDDELLPMEDGDTRKKALINLYDYVITMTITQAKLIYQHYIYLTIYEKIESQNICNHIFDMTVQHGKKKAAELTQRAINAWYYKQLIEIDGILGNETLHHINYISSFDELRPLLCAVRESLFRCIVAHDKSQKRFLEGWLKRCYR